MSVEGQDMCSVQLEFMAERIIRNGFYFQLKGSGPDKRGKSDDHEPDGQGPSGRKVASSKQIIPNPDST